MRVLLVEGLPAEPLAAAADFHARILPQIAAPQRSGAGFSGGRPHPSRLAAGGGAGLARACAVPGERAGGRDVKAVEAALAYLAARRG
jgi:hypothetical protein